MKKEDSLLIINTTSKKIVIYCHQTGKDGDWETANYKYIAPGERCYIKTENFTGKDKDGISIEEDL